MVTRAWWLAAALFSLPAAASAQSPRDLLTQASFHDRDQATAMRHIVGAHSAATAQLRRQPDDREAALMQATALGYRAKLTGSRQEAVAARRAMEQLVAKHPNDPERQLALGAWHMGAVNRVGRIVARAALGASKGTGLSALDRAVALGGDRALFPGLTALLRLQMDPADARARQLAEVAAKAAAPTPLDRQMKRAAATMLGSLKGGNAGATRKLAAKLLPLGWIDGD